MKLVSRLVILFLILFDVLVIAWIVLHDQSVPLLFPQGTIAIQERDLMLFAIGLGLAISIPVLFILFSTVFRYRESSKKTSYTPDAVNNASQQLFLWAIPIIIISILAFVTWKTTHTLDPYKSIRSGNPPLLVQVVALRWKWLFIYPQQHIATINYLRFPTHTPISITLTSDDAPMNSFWIPGLVGQMYSMTGMGTHVHFLSDTPGQFTGSAAEISGQGFAGMRFVASATSQSDFDRWVQSVRQSSKPLTNATYAQLLNPSENNPPAFYSSVDDNFYTMIMMKYMMPTGQMMK